MVEAVVVGEAMVAAKVAEEAAEVEAVVGRGLWKWCLTRDELVHLGHKQFVEANFFAELSQSGHVTLAHEFYTTSKRQSPCTLLGVHIETLLSCESAPKSALGFQNGRE